MSPSTRLAIFVSACVRIARADSAFSYFNFTLDDTVSGGCVAALQAPLSGCDVGLQTIASAASTSFSTFDDPAIQDSLCNSTCASSLSSYVAAVGSNCAQDDPFGGFPATYYGLWIQGTYNLTCVKNGSQYCSDVFYGLGNDSTQDTTLSSFPPSQLCQPCVLDMLQEFQSNPFSNYGESSEQVADYVSIQSKCQTSFPTATPSPIISKTSSLPGYAAGNSSYAGGCASGTYHSVASGDTVQGIAEKNSVSTGTLIVLNNLLPDGSDLQAGQSLCLPNTCKTYQPSGNDTCYSIASNNDMSYPLFFAWNPDINAYCTNLILGRNYCIGSPFPAYNASTVSGATGTKTAVFATATVAAPGPTGHGTTTQCGKYYQVQSGDYCQLVALNQTVDLSLFEAINPSIDSKCDNLIPGLWYCVEPLQSWNGTNGTVTTTSTYEAPPAPTPSGSTNRCYQWYTIQSGDNCYNIEQSFGITMDQFQLWNPQLAPNCSNLLLGDAYCVDSDVGSTATASSSYVPPPTQTPPGSTKDCYTWYTVQSGGSCYSIEQAYAITIDQLVSWNPNLKSDCSNLLLGEAYCVNSDDAVSSAASKRSVVQTPPPTATALSRHTNTLPRAPGQAAEYDLLVRIASAVRS